MGRGEDCQLSTRLCCLAGDTRAAGLVSCDLAGS
jgi:hypothetical protein